ncbi:cysteine synthase [Cohnella sp. CIP 111063]|uniref:PLP-dependent cysteine synthase family protein n=1 Tax=unclassified Cohnella TaxID=2636738 RepID=UPI000B8C44B3|nr:MULTISPECIES: cysteine synthase family protein [unclassified Cohnella]OXS54080.1 cysteine synthase [Cohnella sp. CIP 111063]PRX62956.1 cystathionine beta-synthase/cysteine synthase A [Cohnella sp. SGD-V74]
MIVIANILETVGNTPLLTSPNSNRADEGQLLFKYERYNPGGSIKDRAALFIVEEAERRGWLKPGGTIIESSSGNFGISLAMIGAAKGYRVVILVDPKTTSANLALLKGFGAEVIVVTEQDDSGSYHKTRISLANRLAREIENSYRPDQCFNLLNSEAHFRTTAREIVEACSGRLAAFVTAVSTGGQLGGISRYLKTYVPEAQVVGVDAVGSTIFGGDAEAYRIPGIGLSWTPDNLNVEDVDSVYKVADEQAFLSARAFARNEGILMGPSSGACALVALKIAQELKPGQRVVCMVSDGGDRYVQTLFNDEWMDSQGFAAYADVAEIREAARQLRPWSGKPAGNYRPELTAKLDVPESTLLLNAELRNSRLGLGTAVPE